MNRRDCLKLIGLAGANPLILSQNAALEKMAHPRMNVIFILADDLGWSDLGCYNADLHETPNLDRLAQNNLRFTNAYAAGPVCSPTRASIMTGKCPARLNFTIWREAAMQRRIEKPNTILSPPLTETDLSLNEITLAELFQKAGYRTAHIGKWHVGDAEHYPETQGFEVNIGGTVWGAPQTYWYPYRGQRNEDEFRYIPHLEFGQKGEYLTDRLTDEALHCIDTFKNEPFFLNMAYHTVHTPIQGKPDYTEYFRGKIKPEMNHQNPGYAAMVRSLDENVGRILDKLDDLHLANRTVVIFFSDNGGYTQQNQGMTVTNNAPLRSGKGSLYEGGIRVPLIVRWPGVTPQGAVCHTPVISDDFFPTCREWLADDNSEIADTVLDGISLLPVLHDPDAKLPREELGWHYPHYYPTTTPVSAIRYRQWKLLEYYEDGRLELYNLEDDLGETQNLANRLPEKTAELHSRLKEWRSRMGAQLPQKNPQ